MKSDTRHNYWQRCYAECHLSFMLVIFYAECRKQTHYAECHYAECRYAECRGVGFEPYPLG